jgi:hypothetical protein
LEFLLLLLLSAVVVFGGVVVVKREETTTQNASINFGVLFIALLTSDRSPAPIELLTKQITESGKNRR